MKSVHLLFFLGLMMCASLRGEVEKTRAQRTAIANEQVAKPPRPMHPITPCAGPKVRNGMDINLQADFIYWTARLDTLTYAMTGLGDLLGSTNPKKGQMQSVDWSWDPGFKVGIGWNFNHGCWDMLLQYTWHYTNVSNSKSSQSLQPSFEVHNSIFELQDISHLDRAHAQFDLHYQIGDLEFGRNYYVSKTLKLRPFVGIKGTWQKQDYGVFYVSSPLLQTVFHYNIKFDHAIWGLGARIGLNSSWQFAKAFSLYGNIALTGIWLHYDTGRKDTFSGVTNQIQRSLDTAVYVQDRLRLIKPVMEFALGLRMETYFANNRYHILLQAGWESQIWVNQTLYISLNNHYDRFDLNLQGLTAKFRFDF